MADGQINPGAFTERVLHSYLRYQLTAYPFTDDDLRQQMRLLLSLENSRRTPLFKGPYVSLSRTFRDGSSVAELARQGVLHPFLQNIAPHPKVRGHQEEAIRAIVKKKHTLVSTGTGSGKTEAFLYPIISHCLRLRDEGAAPGVSAVIIYPMNALAEDQLDRLREILAGTGISFGMYVGKTPEKESDVEGQLRPGATQADYKAAVARARGERVAALVRPAEEACSREAMRDPQRKPRILLTNVKQLELLLTRQTDAELFANARLDHLVVDEAHTFSGSMGAETACLIRRLRAFCGKGPDATVCIATSATIASSDGDEGPARNFASRFFGVDPSKVKLVKEDYEPDVWSATRSWPAAPVKAAQEILSDLLAALGDEDGQAEQAVKKALKELGGGDLESGAWQQALGKALAGNELLHAMDQLLSTPKVLQDLTLALGEKGGRTVAEEEVIAWLILGAEARVGDRPFLRPVVHGFVRGMSGAVVTFPLGSEKARLWLAAEDAVADEVGKEALVKLQVTTCTTCGQHYYVHFAEDFKTTGNRPEGGVAVGERKYWPAKEGALGGIRAVLVDRLLGTEGDEEEDEDKVTPVFLCRHCGALHPEERQTCDGCGRTAPMVRLLAIQTNEKKPGWLKSCCSCKAKSMNFGFYREPARALRAVQVADVHVLAQEMLQHAARKRLLIFADNRQEAAFQAGWMRDHARRFRLREMMHRFLAEGPMRLGDLVGKLDVALEADNSLSRQLLREVWDQYDKDDYTTEHRNERKHYLRIQALREITPTFKQRIGLEPWGKLRIDYEGLAPSNPFIAKWATKLGMDPAVLADGVAGCLDNTRRKFLLYDEATDLYSKFWTGSREVQYGYFPEIQGVPKGVKLTRDPNDDKVRVEQWLGDHRSLLRDIAIKWGVSREEAPAFVTELWDEMNRLKLLVTVALKGWKGRTLPKTSGSRQLDVNKLTLHAQDGRWRCGSCRRVYARRAPLDRCLAWNCKGTLAPEASDPDNYDLQVLDGSYGLLRPREHTAQVPGEEREKIERDFKDQSRESVNTLVATQTLELGVDIGPLDVVLMRNVPPFPANYWQRVGRAGRRFRMAVHLTYARSGNSHDRAYFKEPMKMLAGRVEPPSFNLRNSLMVAKHVHASVLTRLFQEARTDSALKQKMDALFPPRVKTYFFNDDESMRAREFDFSPLVEICGTRSEALLAYVEAAFSQHWPELDKETVSRQALQKHVDEMPQQMADTMARVRRRLQWASAQLNRLARITAANGVLEPEEEALRKRCEDLIKKIKGLVQQRARGYDESNTFNLLAGEGFLPGYGLDTGMVRGFAVVPRIIKGIKDFELPRPTATALREFVPGNRIYANGHRFMPRFYHLQNNDPLVFHVDRDRQAVSERAATGAGTIVTTTNSADLVCVPIGDVNLAHSSRIGDSEESRFQLPVVSIGLEQHRHGGGLAYAWGQKEAHFRRNVHFRIVNAGPASDFSEGTLGYPVCQVCGDSRSPFSSDAEMKNFTEHHVERCGKAPERVGFYADIEADALTFPNCASLEEAVSLAETIRLAASNILEMEVDDLDVLYIPHPSEDAYTAVLYDPMPGGSGLLQQLLERFAEVHAEATRLATECPGACDRSCIDCLQHYRNLFNHRHLDRRLVASLLAECGSAIAEARALPSQMPVVNPEAGHEPTNQGEAELKALIAEAGLPDGDWQHQLPLGAGMGTTTPDCFYEDPFGVAPGICIYLDGLSRAIHGNPERQARDREIRSHLKALGYEVLELPVSALPDRGAMGIFLSRLGRLLVDAERARAIRQRFTEGNAVAFPAARPQVRFKRVAKAEARPFVDCVPIYTLQAAAGGFSDSQAVEEAGEWARIEGGKALAKGMFVAQVVGRSMEPTIPNGAWCLFRGPVEGTRQGKVLLVQHREISDPETGGSYTVKRWKSEKVADGEGGWKHSSITLEPDNKEFKAIALGPQLEDTVAVVAEFLEALTL